MINKQKTETRTNIFGQTPTQPPRKKESKTKASPSPNKILKYNYKLFVERMQERSLNSRPSFKKVSVCHQLSQQDTIIPYEQECNQEIKSHHIRQSFLQTSKTSHSGKTLRACQEKKQGWRQRAASLSNNFIQHNYDERWGSLSKIDRKSSEATVRKQRNSINPYTKSQYLYAKNQGKDQEIRRKIANQNRISFGLNLQKSCKISSFELLNPLQRYDKAEKGHKTTSTLPEYFMDEPQSEQFEKSPKLKVHSKQIPISYRKKSAYYKHLRHAQVPLPSSTKNSHIQAVFNDFEPTPWESSIKHCDLFYLRVEQM